MDQFLSLNWLNVCRKAIDVKTYMYNTVSRNSKRNTSRFIKKERMVIVHRFCNLRDIANKTILLFLNLFVPVLFGISQMPTTTLEPAPS